MKLRQCGNEQHANNKSDPAFPAGGGGGGGWGLGTWQWGRKCGLPQPPTSLTHVLSSQDAAGPGLAVMQNLNASKAMAPYFHFTFSQPLGSVQTRAANQFRS